MLFKFSPRFLYFAFLNIHRWINIANITPYGPDNGSAEPKRYSVDFTSSEFLSLMFANGSSLESEYFAFLNIHRWLNIANIPPHGPDDGSVEPKRSSVD